MGMESQGDWKIRYMLWVMAFISMVNSNAMGGFCATNCSLPSSWQ